MEEGHLKPGLRHREENAHTVCLMDVNGTWKECSLTQTAKGKRDTVERWKADEGRIIPVIDVVDGFFVQSVPEAEMMMLDKQNQRFGGLAEMDHNGSDGIFLAVFNFARQKPLVRGER